MKPNLITHSVGSLLILRQSKDDPTDGEWAECINRLNGMLHAPRDSTGRGPRVLVCTDGGAPNEQQRALLQKALKNTPIPVAVVSDDLKARITSASVALANRHHRSFSVADWDRACEHLSLSLAEKQIAEAELLTMNAGFIDRLPGS
jgi:hypothetical protein